MGPKLCEFDFEFLRTYQIILSYFQSPMESLNSTNEANYKSEFYIPTDLHLWIPRNNKFPCFDSVLIFYRFSKSQMRLHTSFDLILLLLPPYRLRATFLLGWWSKSILVLIEKKGTICCSSKALLKGPSQCTSSQ